MFEVGDRVEFVSGRIIDGNKYLVNGARGTVVHIYADGDKNIGVEWDEGRNELLPDPIASSLFHSCQGKCKQGYGWYVDDADIILIEENKTEIQIEADDLFALF